MAPRSLPQNLLDDVAFPIRVKVRVPETGFGVHLIEILRWLREELGEGNFARHETDSLDGEALALHFRRIEDALEFLSSFPEVSLADGTTSRMYRFPQLPGKDSD